ncbi:hypothetical protein CR513_45276, partial [Mucuna pruriens]
MKIPLTPLSPKQVCEDQIKIRKVRECKLREEQLSIQEKERKRQVTVTVKFPLHLYSRWSSLRSCHKPNMLQWLNSEEELVSLAITLDKYKDKVVCDV